MSLNRLTTPWWALRIALGAAAFLAGYVASVWLVGIALNLVTTGRLLDVAVRDALLLGSAGAAAADQQRAGAAWHRNAEDIADEAFDAVYHHILDMSDALSDGIVKQFPGRFEE